MFELSLQPFWRTKLELRVAVLHLIFLFLSKKFLEKVVFLLNFNFIRITQWELVISQQSISLRTFEAVREIWRKFAFQREKLPGNAHLLSNFLRIPEHLELNVKYSANLIYDLCYLNLIFRWEIRSGLILRLSLSSYRFLKIYIRKVEIKVIAMNGFESIIRF